MNHRQSTPRWRRHGALALLVAATLFLAVCEDNVTEPPDVATVPEESPPDAGQPGSDDDDRSLVPATVPLPFAGSVNSSGSAFKITQKGSGTAGEFQNTNVSNNGNAFLVRHSGAGGTAFYAQHSGTGRVAFFEQSNPANTANALTVFSRGSGPGGFFSQVGTGRAGSFQISNTTSPADALFVWTNGTGRAALFQIANSSSQANALEVTTNGRSGAAGFFENTNSASLSSTLGVRTNGRGQAVRVTHEGTNTAGWFATTSSSNSFPAMFIQKGGSGPGPAIVVNKTGSGDMAVFEWGSGNPVIRFDISGRGFFDGGTQTGGADVAEALEVEGRTSAYEPGDVLVISTRADRRVTKTRERYSTRVAGVYATKPGVLLTERTNAEGLRGLVPVGVLGVIPTKVSAENGSVRRGDLLVTARTPGYAMRADPGRLRFGMVLGKALGELGHGKAVIPVLVNVK